MSPFQLNKSQVAGEISIFEVVTYKHTICALSPQLIILLGSVVGRGLFVENNNPV